MGVGGARRAVARAARRRIGRAPAVVLFAQATHIVGDTAVGAALATTLFFDVPVGEARAEVALYLVLAFAPYALLSPIVSRAIGRRDRAHGTAIVASDIGRAVLAALLIGELGGILLYPLGFALLVLSRVHSVSRNSLLPELLEDDDDLLEANAAVSLVSGAAGVVGGGTSLALAATIGPGAALLLATAAFAAGCLAGLWLRPPAPRNGEGPVRVSWVAGAESVRIAGALIGSRAALGFAAMLIAFAFHGPERSDDLAIAFALLAVGTGVAPFTVGIAHRLFSEHLTSAALAALAVAAAVTAPLSGLVGAALLAASVGFFAATARLGFDAHVQERVPEPARGSAYARYETLLQLGWIAGAAVASLLEVSLGLGSYVVIGIAVAGLAGGWLAAARRDEPVGRTVVLGSTVPGWRRLVPWHRPGS